MKHNDIPELPRLHPECIENIFNVYKDVKSNSYYYNLIKALSLPQKLPKTLYKEYSIAPGDTWPTISFKHYDTPNLWWIILYANNILDPTKKLIPGDIIIVFVEDVVKEILTQIRKG